MCKTTATILFLMRRTVLLFDLFLFERSLVIQVKLHIFLFYGFRLSAHFELRFARFQIEEAKTKVDPQSVFSVPNAPTPPLPVLPPRRRHTVECCVGSCNTTDPGWFL